jgi:hypothetical protein
VNFLTGTLGTQNEQLQRTCRPVGLHKHMRVQVGLRGAEHHARSTSHSLIHIVCSRFRSEEWRRRITDGHPERVVLTYVGRLGAGAPILL